jgi:hypothetical protein
MKTYLAQFPHHTHFEITITLFNLVLKKLSIPMPGGLDLGSLLQEMLASPQSTGKELLPFSVLAALISLAVTLRNRERSILEPFLSLDGMSQLLPILMRLLWAHLSPQNIKHHIETVRCIWQLQSALTPDDRTIEACICSFMVAPPKASNPVLDRADAAQKFALIWMHSLQPHKPVEAASAAGSTALHAISQPSSLSSRAKYKIMLSRPLFLLLDALAEEGTENFLWTRSWLQNLPGIEKCVKPRVIPAPRVSRI